MKLKYTTRKGRLFCSLLCFFFAIIPLSTTGQSNSTTVHGQDIPLLENPISVEYIRKNLRKSHPRLVLNKEIERNLKRKLESDPVIQNMYEAIRLNANEILEKELLERVVTGRRLLAVSREMLWRMNMLGMVYRIEKDPEVLQRINDEVVAVSNFTDWNPSHFLDIAEMSMAVALALDWTADSLPGKTVEKAKKALIEKGIKPSWPDNAERLSWVYDNNNWNQVCHGGMIAASIAVAEEEPELAAKTISRALEGIPHALAEYGPDGAYPEGSTYWSYGTSFSVATAAMLESAFGTDFGHSDYPPFMESAVFRVMSIAPSGWYYNYFDCGDRRGKDGDIILAWFAAKTGNKNFYEKERFLMPPEEMGKLPRLAGAALVWMSQYEEEDSPDIPSVWKGDGINPVVIFTGGKNDPHKYYFGGKGGHGSLHHGNMDAGSFIFELDGERWVRDPGNQSYHPLEQTGFDLWGNCQECERWTLLTKNNYGHSTITVNGQLHRVDGHVPMVDFEKLPEPEVTFHMTPAYGNLLKHASRRFIKDTDRSLIIEDKIEISPETEMITWQLMTSAEVEIIQAGALLRQNGKTLKLENLSHPELMLSVVSLDPPPLELDRQIEGLKRLEIRIPAWTLNEGGEVIRIRLSGE